MTIRKAVNDTNINTQDPDSVKIVKITNLEFDTAIEKILKSAQRAQKVYEKSSKEPSEDLYR